MTAAEQQAEPVERTYTSDDMRRLTGVSRRQLSYWAEAAWLPDHRPDDQRTSGRPLTFTQNDVDVVRTVVHLLRVGFVLHRAFGIAAALVADDSYRAEFADVFELTIRCRDTAATPTEETSP